MFRIENCIEQAHLLLRSILVLHEQAFAKQSILLTLCQASKLHGYSHDKSQRIKIREA